MRDRRNVIRYQISKRYNVILFHIYDIGTSTRAESVIFKTKKNSNCGEEYIGFAILS